MSFRPLSALQAQVLGVIDSSRDPLSPADVASHLLVSPSSARSALMALERRGLVAASYSGNRTLARHYTRTTRTADALLAAFPDEPASTEAPKGEWLA